MMRLSLAFLILASASTVITVGPKWIKWDRVHNFCPSAHLISAIGPTSNSSVWHSVFCTAFPYHWEKDMYASEFVDWERAMTVENVWVDCPAGYFLNGVYFSEASGKIANMLAGRCIKPASHPLLYNDCEDIDIPKNRGLKTIQCPFSYFITGFYRGPCGVPHSSAMKCATKVKCCQFMDSSELVNSKYQIEETIMQSTQLRIATLAQNLGFMGTYGCRALYYGEDFQRDGYVWTSRVCNGSHALKIVYQFYPYTIDNTVLMKSNISTSKVSIESGRLYNHDSQHGIQKILRDISVLRSITHTPFTEWLMPSELRSVIVEYVSPKGSGRYKLKFENSEAKIDPKQTSYQNRLTVNSSAQISSHSYMDYEIFLFKNCTRVPYNAYVNIPFGVTISGMLFDGSDSNNPNFYRSYNMLGGQDVAYQIGSERMPFWEVLKRQSNMTMLSSWLWDDMMIRHPDSRQLIDVMTTAEQYTLLLEGEFVETEGMNITLKWQSEEHIPSGK